MSQKNKKRSKLRFLSHQFTRVQVLILLGCFGIGAVVSPLVYATSIQQQINNLDTQNSQTQQTVYSLQSQASSYQGAIAQLQSQITSIQTSIQASQTQQAQLQQQMQDAQAKIVQQKQILSADVEAMYVGGQMTTIEELATSKSLSDFVNADTYRNAVEGQVETTLNQITILQNQIAAQQAQVAQLLQTQQAQQSQLTAAQNQQTQLLSYNQTQQATYTQQIQANNSQIDALKAEQAAANAAEAKGVNVPPGSGSGKCTLQPPQQSQGTGPVGGNGVIAANYPDAWCNDGLDQTNDSNGIQVRECTSFAYWYFVNIEGNSSFTASGYAGWWWETSNYPAITYSSAVKVGAIGVEPSTATSTPAVPSLHESPTGHVMIVVALPGQSYDGVSVPGDDVMVASMNEDEQGHFMYNLWPSADLWYINPQ